MPIKKRLLPSAFAGPMSQAQLVSLRGRFRTPEILAAAMVDSRITPTFEDALRRARLIFCSSPESAAKNTGASQPAPAAETPKAMPQLMVNRKEITGPQMTERILALAEQMAQGPEQGWQAAKTLLDIATFNKQWGVQAYVQLLRLVEGSKIPPKRTLLALGAHPYAPQVDQLALRKFLGGPKVRPLLEHWANSPTHPLRRLARMHLLFM